jgi:hypothetical protein
MRHPSEETLILYHYGELSDPLPIERHIGDCATCRSEYDRLCATLTAADGLAVPEPSRDYAQQLWSRLQPALGDAGRGARPVARRSLASWVPLSPPRLALAGTVAAALFVAFFAGWHWRSQQPAAQGPIPESVRERILLVAVGEHLERSQRLLVELTHAEPVVGEPLDLDSHRTSAARLASRNRLYRRTAADHGNAPLASVLEDLERVLLEIANVPSAGGFRRLHELQRRIDDQGILFRIRVLEETTRRKERDLSGAHGPRV